MKTFSPLKKLRKKGKLDKWQRWCRPISDYERFDRIWNYFFNFKNWQWKRSFINVYSFLNVKFLLVLIVYRLLNSIEKYRTAKRFRKYTDCMRFSRRNNSILNKSLFFMIAIPFFDCCSNSNLWPVLQYHSRQIHQEYRPRTSAKM